MKLRKDGIKIILAIVIGIACALMVVDLVRWADTHNAEQRREDQKAQKIQQRMTQLEIELRGVTACLITFRGEMLRNCIRTNYVGS